MEAGIWVRQQVPGAEYRSVKALRPLLDYLAPLGVLPVPEEVPPGPVEELLGRYQGFCCTSAA